MSERGVFAVDRGVWDHPMFQSREPFTRREAWLWLVSEATWRRKAVLVDGKRVVLERGQLAHSIRFLADKWGWSKSAVARFFDALRTDTMIDTQPGHGVSIITICKYNQYQRVSLPDRDASGTETGTQAGHERDKEEGRKDKEEDSEANASGAGAPPEAAAPVYTDSKHELWGEGVAILVQMDVPVESARKNIGRWLRDFKDDVLVLGAIQRARDARVGKPIGWITQALGNRNGHSTYQNRTSRPDQSGTAAIVAGVGRATGRRARGRLSADRDVAAGADLELFGAPRD